MEMDCKSAHATHQMRPSKRPPGHMSNSVSLTRCSQALECSVQRRKVCLTSTTRCRAVTLPRSETRWNLQGCFKLPDRSQPLVGQSSPHCGDMWRTYCCLTSFFPIVDTCLSCEDIARQRCAMVPRWRFLATFLRRVFSEPHAAGLKTCILNSH